MKDLDELVDEEDQKFAADPKYFEKTLTGPMGLKDLSKLPSNDVPHQRRQVIAAKAMQKLNFGKAKTSNHVVNEYIGAKVGQMSDVEIALAYDLRVTFNRYNKTIEKEKERVNTAKVKEAEAQACTELEKIKQPSIQKSIDYILDL